ncbi:hypothetical protein STEG23_009740 [Scotinomys teguina]
MWSFVGSWAGVSRVFSPSLEVHQDRTTTQTHREGSEGPVSSEPQAYLRERTMGQSVTKPLSLTLDHWKEVQERACNQSVEVRKKKWIALCSSELPALDAGWPHNGTFDRAIISQGPPPLPTAASVPPPPPSAPFPLSPVTMGESHLYPVLWRDPPKRTSPKVLPPHDSVLIDLLTEDPPPYQAPVERDKYVDDLLLAARTPEECTQVESLVKQPPDWWMLNAHMTHYQALLLDTDQAHLQALQLVQNEVWKPLAATYREELKNPPPRTSSLQGPLVLLLLILTFGPCILNRPIQFVKDQLSIVQTMVLTQQYQLLKQPAESRTDLVKEQDEWI